MQVVLANESPEERTRNRIEVAGLGLTCEASDCVSYADLSVRLSRQPQAELVLVVLAPNHLHAGLDAVRLARSYNVPVVAVGPSSDPQLILHATRLGAEYADRAQLSKDLAEVMEGLRHSGRLPFGQAECVSITSALPGSGVTTLATNLAYAWGASYPGKVVLAELAPVTPELSLNLDLKVTHTVDELVRDADRLDTHMLEQAMSAECFGVRVLASRPDTLSPPALNPTVTRKIVTLLRSLFEHATLDLGYGLGPAALEAMRLSETVVVVSKIDIPSLRLTRGYMQALAQAGVDKAKLRLVMNRYGQTGQLAWRKAEEAMPVPALLWIPDDPGSVNAALNAGQPVVQAARRSPLARRVGELATLLNGRQAVTR
jgi:pilus assembly protein CpaE